MQLKKKLILLFLVFGVTPLASLGAFAYYKSSAVMLEQLSLNIAENLTQVNHSINYFVQDIEQLSMYIYSNEVIQNVLEKDGEREITEKYADQKKIADILDSFLGFKNWDISIYLLGENGDRYFTGNILPSAYRDYNVNWGLFRKARLNNGNVVWDTHYTIKKIDDFGVVLSSARMLKNIETNQEIGYLVIDMMERALADKYDKAHFYAGGEIFLLDSKGYVISSTPSKQQVGTKLNEDYVSQVLDGKKGFFSISAGERLRSPAMVIYDTSELTGFKLINVVPVSALTKQSDNVRYVTLLVIFICLFFMMWLAYFLSKNVTRPLLKLRSLMIQVESGNMDVFFTAPTNDEIGQLGRSFNKMLMRIKELIHKVYEKQHQLREAELKMIQAQFNPHFLYNSLDSINWMARLHKVNDISKIAISLGELLRFSIRNDREMIYIREEIKQIRNYLTIQQVRYRDKFTVILDVEEEVEAYFIPKLLLQPLVENAISHGLELKEEQGELAIIAKRIGHKLQFIVRDDGCGMEPSRIAELQSDTYQPSSEGGTGIGLMNVRRRLYLHFGSGASLTIDSEIGQGTVVQIEIPILTVSEENRDVYDNHR